MKKPTNNIWFIPFTGKQEEGFISQDAPELPKGSIEFTPVKNVKLKIHIEDGVDDIDVIIKDGVVIVSQIEDDYEEVIIGYYCMSCGNDQEESGECDKCSSDLLYPVFE